MMDTLWQSIVIFFVPLFAYWGSTIDASSIGDLWTIAVVILVNLHLAMDVFQWTRNTHATIWGSLIATWVCVIVIDAVPSLGDLRNCKDQVVLVMFTWNHCSSAPPPFCHKISLSVLQSL